nr:uncharacterized protein LOC110373031 [Helicoverpa armigera]
MEGRSRCCRCCKAPCAGDFKKIAELKDSKIAIYVYTNKDAQGKENAVETVNTFILHNTGSKQIARPDFMAELKRTRSECGQCRVIVDGIHKLLEEMKHIKGNEVLGICEHCRLAKFFKTPCEKCNYAVSRFISINQKRQEELQQRSKMWLCKVKCLLQSILAGKKNVVTHGVIDPEFERILRECKLRLEERQPDIDTFPKLDQKEVAELSRSKELLEDLISDVVIQDESARFTSETSLYPSPSKEMCLCKFIKKGHHEGKLSHGTMLSGKQKESRHRLLSYQEYCKSLIKRLLDLSKALQQGVPVNKRVVKAILETLNEVGSKGLEPNIVAKLIQQLRDLHSALPHDISKELSKNGIQDLINDLQNLQIKSSSKLQSDDDLNKSLYEKLLELKKALPREVKDNKQLNREIHESLNEVMRKGLTVKVLAKLIKELRDLHNILPQDIYKSVSKEGVKELIDDLNDFLVIAASKNVNKDMLELLVDVSDMVNKELYKKINEHPRKGLHKPYTSYDIKAKSEIIPEGPKKDEAEKTQILPSVQSEKTMEGFPKVESKYSVRGLPSLVKASSGQREDQAQDILKQQSIDDKHELSQDVSKKSMLGLTKSQQSAQGIKSGQSKVDTHDVLKTQSEKSLGKKSMQSLTKVQSKQSTRGLSKAQSEADTRASLEPKSTQDLSKGPSKKSMQRLTKAQSKQSTLVLPGGESKVGADVDLKTQSKDLSRDMSKKSMQRLTKAQSKQSSLVLPGEESKVGADVGLKTQSKDLSRDMKSVQAMSKVKSEDTKDEERELPKAESKKSVQGLLKSQSKLSALKLPRVQSEHGSVSDKAKDGERESTKGESIKSMTGLLKAESRVSTHSLPLVQSQQELVERPKLSKLVMKSILGLPVSPEESQVLLPGPEEGDSSTLIKDGEQNLAGVQSKDDAHDLSKVKDQKGISEKDLQKPSQKDLKQSATADEQGVKKSQTKLTPSKTQEKMEAESSKSDTSSIEATIGLVQKLSDLHQALASRALDKNLVEELAKNISEALGGASPDLLNNIIQELTNLCQPVMEGISDTSNMKKVQKLIENARKALSQGLSEDENKKALKNLLNNLNTTLVVDKKDKKTLSKDLKQVTPKDSSRYLKPPSKKDLRTIRALAAKEAKKQEEIIDTGAEKDTKLGTKTDTKRGISESAPDDISPKKELKTKKGPETGTEKVVPTDKTPEKPIKKSQEGDKTPEKTIKKSQEGDKTPEKTTKKSQEGDKTPEKPVKKSQEGDKTPEKPIKKSQEGNKTPEKPIKKSQEGDKTTQKTRLELASKKATQFKFGGDDDSLGTTEKELKDKSPKEAKSKQPKEEDSQKAESDGKKKKSKHMGGDDDGKHMKDKPKKTTEGEKKPGKTRMELASKKGIQYKFGSDDDSLGSIMSEQEWEKKDQKEATPKKSKENLSPKKGSKKRALKSKSQDKASTVELKKPKQMSESALRRLLSSNRLNAARYAEYKEKQRLKEKEMERRRLRELQLKNMPPVIPKVITPPLTPETSSTILECDVKRVKHPSSMIKGNAIVRYNPRYKERKDTQKKIEPLIFKSDFNIGSDDLGTAKKTEFEPGIDYEAMFRDGVIRYKLSSREFIDNGWTQLPTKKIMRRMNIYKMKPAYPKHDWFELHKHDEELFYDTGQRLALIDANGRGHWFYKNGTVALDYYNAKESNIGQRYVVYSTGTEFETTGSLQPRTILALFDVLGNGVVYDHHGNVRLKYNQTEGLLVDSKVGPPGKWKWHSLNDPPVLQQVFIDQKERDRRLERATQLDRAQEGFDYEKSVDPEMVAIELDNFAKEKKHSLRKKFKPFKIRMKAVKLNNFFSLKILDQGSITLFFRDGATSLKLHLGMHIVSNEIIDTDTSEITDVSTPYDKRPAKTESLENIYQILQCVRTGKIRPPLELTVGSM